MPRPRSVVLRFVVLVGVLVAVAVAGAAVAAGRATDNGVLNQTVVRDTVGDSIGADLSSLTVTSYADASVGFSVGFANRNLLIPNETVQIFVDVNNDGTADVNLSIWPTGIPSYLARRDGSGWTNVRQLPELVQIDGSFSVRLTLADLRGAAAVDPGSSIGVLVGAWTTNPDRPNADDWLPDSQRWVLHQLAPPAAPPPSTTTTTPAPTTPSNPEAAPPRLAVVCVRHALHATVIAAPGVKVASVSFSANGVLRLKDTTAPYSAVIPVKGLRAPITIGATIRFPGKTQTLHTQARPC